MPEILNRRARQIKLQVLGPGIRGRIIPPAERGGDEEFIRKLAEEHGSDEYAKFIYRIYGLKPRGNTRKKP
jgi:hypothetical protein